MKTSIAAANTVAEPSPEGAITPNRRFVTWLVPQARKRNVGNLVQLQSECTSRHRHRALLWARAALAATFGIRAVILALPKCSKRQYIGATSLTKRVHVTPKGRNPIHPHLGRDQAAIAPGGRTRTALRGIHGRNPGAGVRTTARPADRRVPAYASQGGRIMILRVGPTPTSRCTHTGWAALTPYPACRCPLPFALEATP